MAGIFKLCNNILSLNQTQQWHHLTDQTSLSKNHHQRFFGHCTLQYILPICLYYLYKLHYRSFLIVSFFLKKIYILFLSYSNFKLITLTTTFFCHHKLGQVVGAKCVNVVDLEILSLISINKKLLKNFRGTIFHLYLYSINYYIDIKKSTRVKKGCVAQIIWVKS